MMVVMLLMPHFPQRARQSKQMVTAFDMTPRNGQAKAVADQWRGVLIARPAWNSCLELGVWKGRRLKVLPDDVESSLFILMLRMGYT
jgi:hypothetical protein